MNSKFRFWAFNIFFTHLSGPPIFSDISERNNDYSDTLDFRGGWVGEVGVVTFFLLEVPDYESAMFIYIYIYIHRVIQLKRHPTQNA